jgi:hypothetical protein
MTIFIQLSRHFLKALGHHCHLLLITSRRFQYELLLDSVRLLLLLLLLLSFIPATISVKHKFYVLFDWLASQEMKPCIFLKLGREDAKLIYLHISVPKKLSIFHSRNTLTYMEPEIMMTILQGQLLD